MPYLSYLSNRIKQCGHWAIARECCKRGVPFETFYLALLMAQKG
jgi:hypothetical protein